MYLLDVYSLQYIASYVDTGLTRAENTLCKIQPISSNVFFLPFCV